MSFAKICSKVLHIIDTLPKSANGKPYITLFDGRKCFLDVFVKKYGIGGNETKYLAKDISRRIRLIEFFDAFVKLPYVSSYMQGKNEIIDSAFYRMVLGRKYTTNGYRIVLISFYHYI